MHQVEIVRQPLCRNKWTKVFHATHRSSGHHRHSDARLATVIERLAYGELPDQYGELRVPEGGAALPLVILIHGGFWRDQYHCDLMHPLADALYERGYASWNIEYRRVGPTGGG